MAAQLLSSTGLADYLDIPLGTVYTWRRRGGGPPAIRVGRHLRYRPEAVERWLLERESAESGTAPQSRRIGSGPAVTAASAPRPRPTSADPVPGRRRPRRSAGGDPGRVQAGAAPAPRPGGAGSAR